MRNEAVLKMPYVLGRFCHFCSCDFTHVCSMQEVHHQGSRDYSTGLFTGRKLGYCDSCCPNENKSSVLHLFRECSVFLKSSLVISTVVVVSDVYLADGLSY